MELVSDIIIWTAVVAATVCQDLRWLRVAQREDYAPARPLVLAGVWLRSRPVNIGLLALAVVAVLAGLLVRPWPTLLGAAALVVWPFHLKLLASSKPLAWTPRMKRLAIVLGVLQLALLAALWRPERAALVPLLTVPLVAAVCWVMWQVEAKLSHKWVESAQARLAKVRPTIVAITGSYGKTSTKLYTNRLLSGRLQTVASPASFNNLMGLSRTVNDRLTPGTEVLIAEMGTYGPGEIRELCQIFKPTIACITTIGEAHLERMRNRATIVAAKSEITEDAPEVVLNIDVPELAALADKLDATKRVMRVSETPGARADVIVAAEQGRWLVSTVQGPLADIPAPEAGHPINLAVAVAVAILLDVPSRSLVEMMQELPNAQHRAEAQRTAEGVQVFDDTYNSNPDGAHTALTAAVRAAGTSRVFTVTPGMVELGAKQAERNQAFAREATAAANHALYIVGYTNRAALLAGAKGQPGTVRWFATRSAAAAAAMAEARPGDAVLFENDLPDHYA